MTEARAKMLSDVRRRKRVRVGKMYKFYQADPKTTVEDVAKRFGLAAVTVYSYFRQFGFELRPKQPVEGVTAEEVMKQNADGSWSPSIPLPFYYGIIHWVAHGRFGCKSEDCGKFWKLSSYENHYRHAHVA